MAKPPSTTMDGYRNDSDEDEEDLDEQELKAKKLLNSCSPLQAALTCAKAVMLSKIHSSEDDQVAILLYNTVNEF